MTLHEQIELACLMEATARKPGNVHPGASFADLTYDDFVRAAAATAEPLAEASRVGVGRAVFNAIEATRRETGTNVNLGIALLIAPLAAVPNGVSLGDGIRRVLSGTTIEDAEHVYAAIRLAKPGGLGEAATQDVKDVPTVTLREAMALAANRDQIAEQYVTDFELVRVTAAGLHGSWVGLSLRDRDSSRFQPEVSMPVWEAAIIQIFIRLISKYGDSLIARKCGSEVNEKTKRRATVVLEAGGCVTERGHSALADFDRGLRVDGHRRNPGTTADLIAATLFAALRDGLIEAPSRDDVLKHAAKIRAATARGNN
jgi:triphosphoribosyl-dephospho-CoA synthase